MHISVEDVAYQSSCQYRCWGEEVSQSFSQNQVGFDKQILSYVQICLLPSEVSLQLKILPKNIYKNKCREDEIDTIFNSPCLFTSNALIQFKQLMLIYEECFNTAQIAHACLRRIFQCGRVYLHFTYNDIYICYNVTFSKNNTIPWLFFKFFKLCRWRKIALHIPYFNKISITTIQLTILLTVAQIRTILMSTT